jgi:hypothetical protein
MKRWKLGNDEWSGGGRRALYKQQELEIVKWENKYCLKTRVKVDVGESKASREYRGGPLPIVWRLISCAMPTVWVPSLPHLTLSNSRGTYILSFCTSSSWLSLLVLSLIKCFAGLYCLLKHFSNSQQLWFSFQFGDVVTLWMNHRWNYLTTLVHCFHKNPWYMSHTGHFLWEKTCWCSQLVRFLCLVLAVMKIWRFIGTFCKFI